MNRRDAMIAYGVGPTMASELVQRYTPFARAVRYFGPLLCYYVKNNRCWTLHQRRVTKRQIIRRAGWRAAAKDAAD